MKPFSPYTSGSHFTAYRHTRLWLLLPSSGFIIAPYTVKRALKASLGGED